MDKFNKRLPNPDSLLTSIEEILQSNTGFYYGVLQRSVLRRIGTARIEHGITIITGWHISEPTQSSRRLDYGELLLIQESLDLDTFRERLKKLCGGWLITEQFCFLLNQQRGISENVEGSRNDYCSWPGKLFEIYGDKPNLTLGPLLNSKGLPFYKDSFSAIKSFLGVKPFHNDSDGRLGSILFFLPNCHARLEHLQLVEPTRLMINLYLEPALDKTRTKLHIDVQGQNYQETLTYDADHSILVELKQRLTQVAIWLHSEEFGLLDMYEETPYYVYGDWPAILPKLQANNSVESTFESVAPRTGTHAKDEQRFFPSGSHHDAYVKIRDVVGTANVEITIVDPYVDGSLFTLLTNIPNSVKIRILTQQTKPDLSLEAKKFQTQHGHTLEIRSTSNYHDRFVVIDGAAVWHLGASIKDAGAKAFVISEMQRSTVVTVKCDIEARWSSATVIF